MPLMRALGSVLRLVRLSKGLSQEELSGVVEARHVHNLEHAKSSITLDTLEALADRLQTDPVALLALSARIESGVPTVEYLAHLQLELQKLAELGIEDKIAEYYRDGEVLTQKRGRRSDPDKVTAVLEAKAAGKTKKQVSEELGIARSTVNDIWKRG